MKTRLLIIIGIITIVSAGSFVILFQTQLTNSNETHLSSLLKGDSLCFDSFDEEPVEICYSLDELETYSCSISLLEYLAQYSNLLDADFTGLFYIEWPSLPNNISEKDYDACIEFLNSIRLPLKQENESLQVTDSLTIPNAERDAKLAAGYKLYPGVGWVHPDDQGSQKPIYGDNPNNPGELVLDIDAMIKEYNLDQEINAPVYPRFDNGITEIINPEFEHLEYRATSPVIDDTYLSKNVQQWKDAWEYELEVEYEKYGDDFYTELDRLLIKNEMQLQMDNMGIINANDDFEVYSGMMLSSLPPHIGFSAVIFATDENYYRLEGGTFANQVSYYRTTQLQFPDITEKLSMESILSKPQLITIIPEDGNKSRQEPSTLVVHIDNNVVEFFNNTPEVIRIQDSGSGRVGEENTLGWMGPIILPFQKTTVTFDKPGLIEWDARNAPNLEDLFWWSTHAGGEYSCAI